MREKHPTKIPIIILASDEHTTFSNPKLLFPAELACSSLKSVLRKKMTNYDASKALFVYTARNKLVSDLTSIGDLAAKQKTTGILYLKVAHEEVYGQNPKNFPNIELLTFGSA